MKNFKQFVTGAKVKIHEKQLFSGYTGEVVSIDLDNLEEPRILVKLLLDEDGISAKRSEHWFFVDELEIIK